MPFKSKKQMWWMAWAESKGKLKKGTFKRWAKETKNIKKLPLKAKKRK